MRGSLSGKIRVGVGALVLLGISACTVPEVPYEEGIASWRTDKDRFMRESPESPVAAGDRATFPALPYFPIDQEYRVPASLSVSRADDILEMQTSTGQRRKMQRIGKLEFTLKGQPLKLTAFAEASDTQLRRLFVPFHDLTNGSETYLADGTSTSTGPRPASTISISIAPIIRSAFSTRPTTARCLRARTVS